VLENFEKKRVRGIVDEEPEKAGGQDKRMQSINRSRPQA
jgi:hypothetical protein